MIDAGRKVLVAMIAIIVVVGCLALLSRPSTPATTPLGAMRDHPPSPGTRLTTPQTLAPFIVPNVVGQSSQSALGTLTVPTSGPNPAVFAVDVRDAPSSRVAAGDVSSQSPQAGRTVAEDSLVTIVVSTGTVYPSAAPTCAATEMSIRVVQVGQMMQQSAHGFVSVNTASSTCQLAGYPMVTLLNADQRPLPFRYLDNPGDHASTSGDMVSNGAPEAVPLAPGQAAFVMINGDACQDGGPNTVANTATSVRLTPPGSGDGLTIALPDPLLESCPEPIPASISVFPVEPSDEY